MSLEQKLHDLGAECVCGDLLLNRVLVGRYRDGAFIPTPEASEVVAQAEAASSGAVEVVEAPQPTRPARAPRAAKPKAETPLVEEVPAAPEAAPAVDDPLAGLDDILNQ